MIRKIKSFNFQGLKIKVYPQVYDPAEDTFQLLESIEIALGDDLLEIGCGSGIISLYFAKKGVKVVSSDISSYAVENTMENYEINKDKIKGTVDVRTGDLFKPIKQNENFDVIVFNPPYLPTENKDIIKDEIWYNKAINGGKDGLKYTKKFIFYFQQHHQSAYFTRNYKHRIKIQPIC